MTVGFKADGTLKLFDFGLARCVQRRQRMNARYDMTGETVRRCLTVTYSVTPTLEPIMTAYTYCYYYSLCRALDACEQ
jgi:hypothetical protein